MGEVYLAMDSKLGRKVALKFLSGYFTKEADRLRRFEQEARAASALNHPNILTIHEIGKTSSREFIASEFVDGETLRETMTDGPLKIADALKHRRTDRLCAFPSPRGRHYPSRHQTRKHHAAPRRHREGP